MTIIEALKMTRPVPTYPITKVQIDVVKKRRPNIVVLFGGKRYVCKTRISVINPDVAVLTITEEQGNPTPSVPLLRAWEFPLEIITRSHCYSIPINCDN